MAAQKVLSQIVWTYNKTKGSVDAMHQSDGTCLYNKKENKTVATGEFTTLCLASIASRVVIRVKYQGDTLSHTDNRQYFIDIGWLLAFAQILPRSPMPSLQNPIEHKISTVINYLQSKLSKSSNSAIPPKKGKDG
ncbi:hypothetical protein PoB_007699100 [Plakobranchus ocellatus]|uniref:Uncharacterized protein n=1 Tax=Plakobranchus ocellatus TaxID=259542 RepID=A0AAV4E3N8_9GAST|nr:hypothetical protein PoB_007699100 [Plakobranchus ocellatus]